ncbi:MAG: hypothetical protein LBG26_05410 [Treponema sp.]|jgi:hypothetical protein|nr:hypothetical protein [Treponema sp.]
MKSSLFIVPAALLALCVLGCPNPWLNRMFKRELPAFPEVSGWALVSSQRSGLSHGTYYITYDSGVPQLVIRLSLKNLSGGVLDAVVTWEPLSGPCALTVSVPVQEDGEHLRFTVDGTAAGDRFRLKPALTDGDGRHFEHAVIFDVSNRGVVSTAVELAAIGTALAGDYILTKDLALNNWTPIGDGSAFTGSFEGNGHTLNLKGFNPAALDDACLGIFGQTNGADIQNLMITADSAHITLTGSGDQRFGLAAGYAQNGTLENIVVSGGNLVVEKPGGGVLDGGGIAGQIETQTISGCTVSVNLEMYNASETVQTGSIAGRVLSGGTVENCRSYGNVKSVGAGSSLTTAGGIAGYCNGEIHSCSADGDMYCKASSTGSAMAGGIAGYITALGTVKECYASGNIDAVALIVSSYAGGIAGMTYSRIAVCYSTGNISAQSFGSSAWAYAGGIVGNSGDASSVVEYTYAVGRISAVHSHADVNCDALAGGVVARGYTGSVTNHNAALSRSVAASVSGGTAYARRVLGSNQSGTLTDNIAYTSMTGVIGSLDVTANGQDGLSRSGAELKNQSTYEALGWNFTPGTGQWKMTAGYPYPVLQWQTSPPAIDSVNVIP